MFNIKFGWIFCESHFFIMNNHICEKIISMENRGMDILVISISESL